MILKALGKQAKPGLAGVACHQDWQHKPLPARILIELDEEESQLDSILVYWAKFLRWFKTRWCIISVGEKVSEFVPRGLVNALICTERDHRNKPPLHCHLLLALKARKRMIHCVCLEFFFPYIPFASPTFHGDETLVYFYLSTSLISTVQNLASVICRTLNWKGNRKKHHQQIGRDKQNWWLKVFMQERFSSRWGSHSDPPSGHGCTYTMCLCLWTIFYWFPP